MTMMRSPADGLVQASGGRSPLPRRRGIAARCAARRPWVMPQARPGSSRRDRKAFLLARVGDVAHGRALHVPPEAQVVERGAAVHGAAIVPHHEVVDAPAVGIDELPPGGMLDQLV